MGAPEIKVGGTWLTSIEPSWGDLELTWRWPYGCYQAEWSMLLKPGQRPTAIERDVPVEVYEDGWLIWAGTLPEPDWSASEFVAQGYARQAEGVPALTDTGTTSTPDAAIDYAIGQGWVSWSRPSSISSTPLTAGDETATSNGLNELLDAWSDEAGQRWYVTPDRVVRKASDPTSPSFLIHPDADVLGVASEAVARTLVGEWNDAAGNLQITIVGSGRPIQIVDLIKRGVADSGRATTVLTNMLAKTGALGGWTNGLTLTRDQITTLGGVHPHLGHVGELVAGGCMIRLLGQADPRGVEMHTDVVVGEAIWDVEGRTITLNPVGMAARDFPSIVEAAAGPEVA